MEAGLVVTIGIEEVHADDQAEKHRDDGHVDISSHGRFGQGGDVELAGDQLGEQEVAGGAEVLVFATKNLYLCKHWSDYLIECSHDPH
jgi:hypothetical protein